MSCGVDCRRGWDPALLWLWRRPVAAAPIQPLAWEPPYALEAALEKTKKKKKKKKKEKKKKNKKDKKKKKKKQKKQKKKKESDCSAAWVLQGCRFNPWPCSVG